MKLLEQVTVVARRLRLAPNTISVYVSWVRQFLTFSAAAHGGWKHPAELGTADVEAFLNDLVLRRRLSASAQNQALCALVFLYRQVLEDVIPQQHLGKFLLQRSRRLKRIPVTRPFLPEDDHDLHPRDEQAGGGRDQPTGSPGELNPGRAKRVRTRLSRKFSICSNYASWCLPAS